MNNRMKRGIKVFLVWIFIVCFSAPMLWAQEDISDYTIFDDKTLLEGYAKKYREFSEEIVLEMIKDDTLSPYKAAAAIRVFRENFSADIVSREKKIAEKFLLRRFKLTDSAFVEVEIMHVLCAMDRYRYFQTMVPALIQKLNHYNSAVNEIAFNGLNDVTKDSGKRPREARIVFNTLRKMLFLSRKRLANVGVPDERLSMKLKLLRWSIKVLGPQELKKLPKEVISLL